MKRIGNEEPYDFFSESTKLINSDSSRPEKSYVEERLHKLEDAMIDTQGKLNNGGMCKACNGLLDEPNDFPICSECLHNMGSITQIKRNSWTLK